MQALARRSLHPSTCRRAQHFALVVGRRRRRPSILRSFHTSPADRASTSPATDPIDPASQQTERNAAGKGNGATETDGATAKAAATGDGVVDPHGNVARQGRQRGGFYGSAVNRAGRSRKQKESVAATTPEWFVRRNVRLHGSSETPRASKGAVIDCALVVKDKATGNVTGKVEFDVGAHELRDVVGPLLKAWGGDEGLRKLEEHFGQARGDEVVAKASGDIGDRKHAEDESSRRSLALHPLIEAEIKCTVAASLSLARPEVADSFAATKTNLVLQCPRDGGIRRLNELVDGVADNLGADVIRLDAQDIVQLSEGFVGRNSPSQMASVETLGYDTHRPVIEDAYEDGTEETEDAEDVSADDGAHQPPDSFRSHHSNPVFDLPRVRVLPIVMAATGKTNFRDLLKASRAASANMAASGGHLVSPEIIQSEFAQPDQQPAKGKMEFSAVLEMLVEANLTKRAALAANSEFPTSSHGPDATDTETDQQGDAEAKGELKPLLQVALTQMSDPYSTMETLLQIQSRRAVEHSSKSPLDPTNGLKPTIIHVQDIKELETTRAGGFVLKTLAEVVERRRKEGRAIMIIGTTSSAELVPETSKSGFQALQAEDEHSLSRSIVVPFGRIAPKTKALNGQESTTESRDVWHQEECERRVAINLRNMQDVIRRFKVTADEVLGGDPPTQAILSPQHIRSLRLRLLSFDEVHRIILTAVGLQAQSAPLISLGFGHITNAMTLLSHCDELKFEWLNGSNPHKTQISDSSSNENLEDRLSQLEKGCSRHEKRLLPGVVRPETLKTTFNDVHAPAEFIETLKELTTLSLLRPDAFKYGVLAADKIPGLLLYGPPGTGKTLLAKAVAKDSGAAVLEVSGAEVNDMYVGEGEKNVKAIFSLARKLAPCVVFIDEADAIFGQRSGASNRSSHREIINQFLREWDGMATDLGVFVMVATNRPFDLDDAVLRRLPRRLLVDLPLEPDREAILRIHLREETIDPGVHLADLAAKTPHYSGSDLKNLAVAAALAAVREENAAAQKARPNAGEDLKFPEQRVLLPRHFETAMEQISASVSEDMSSLGAIKKFDERYGDRRGRRKRGAWGFALASEKEREDAARVRP